MKFFNFAQKIQTNNQGVHMRTINLIPANYEGSPHDAIGYSWATLVMDGWRVDKSKSIPGEDLSVNAVECYAMLEAEHGTIAIRDNSSYGRLSSEGKTRDGKTVNIDGLAPVATINGMWCGGINVTVYAVADEPTKESSVEPMVITGAEAAAFGEVFDSVEDKANEHKLGLGVC